MPDASTDAAVRDSQVPAGPLAGIRVLDLSRFIAGPYCAMLLGDLGADVVKVESPGKGENTRAFLPRVGEESLYTVIFNRNKRGLTINFRSAEGQALLRDLVKVSDVVVENFVPGTLEKMGCGWDAMRALNPRLIMTRISGFGQTGPHAQRPCFDVIAQAMSGMMEITGQEDGPPTMAGTFVVDYTTALYATIGTLSALQGRQITGKGQLVDAALLDSALSMLFTAISEQILFGRGMTRIGNRDRFAAPANTFRAKDGGWVQVIVAGDPKFRQFAEAIGRPELCDDPRFATNAARLENVAAIEAVVAQWVARHSCDEVLAFLERLAIPCAKIATLAEVVENPQVRHRGQILEVEHPTAGTVPMQGFPFQLSGTPMSLRRPTPSIGQHTQEVLEQWIGLPPARISDLRERGAI